MSSTDISTKQVRNKVLYSELDVPYNKYLDILNKVTRFTHKVLNGTINEHDEDEVNMLSVECVDEMLETAQFRFLTLQNSLESKKISFENWQQSNLSLLNTLDDKAKESLPSLLKCRDHLTNKFDRLTRMYKNVDTINREIELLSDGRTSISITKEQWEDQLGKSLTERLIKENYLRRENNNNNNNNNKGRILDEDPNKIKYRAIDDFSVAPKESQRVNKTLKEDLKKLTRELDHYKDLWLKDAEVFLKVTELFQEELKKRHISTGDVGMNMDVADEEEEEDVVDEIGEENDFEMYHGRSHDSLHSEEDGEGADVPDEYEEEEDMIGENEDEEEREAEAEEDETVPNSDVDPEAEQEDQEQENVDEDIEMQDETNEPSLQPEASIQKPEDKQSYPSDTDI